MLHSHVRHMENNSLQKVAIESSDLANDINPAMALFSGKEKMIWGASRDRRTLADECIADFIASQLKSSSEALLYYAHRKLHSM